MKPLLVLSCLALMACAPEPQNPFEPALGPPPVQTSTSVTVSAGTNGVDVDGSITRTRGNFSYGIGF